MLHRIKKRSRFNMYFRALCKLQENGVQFSHFPDFISQVLMAGEGEGGKKFENEDISLL